VATKKSKTTAAKPTAKKTVKKSVSVKKTVAKPAASKTAKPVAAKGKVAAKAAVKKPVKKVVAKKDTKTAAKAIKAMEKNSKVTKKVAKQPAQPGGMPEQVRDTVLRVLDERQAEQIVTIDLRGRSSMADYLIIASGRAARQIAAIADLLRMELGKLGIKQVRAEGTGEGNWVLVDAGDVILHLFRPEVRGFYNIEQIYGEEA